MLTLVLIIILIFNINEMNMSDMNVCESLIVMNQQSWRIPPSLSSVEPFYGPSAHRFGSLTFTVLIHSHSSHQTCRAAVFFLNPKP